MQPLLRLIYRDNAAVSRLASYADSRGFESHSRAQRLARANVQQYLSKEVINID